MAFISEVNFRGSGTADGEFVEITLGPGDDPANFVVSVYRNDGTLHTGAGISGGEVTLSSLVGVPDPDNAAYTIYVISVGIRNGGSDANEGSGVSLTDTSGGGGVVGFHSANKLAPITASAGAANGATSTATLNHQAFNIGESIHWDINGNQLFGPISGGDAILCVTAEARIKTLTGETRACDLTVGDLVWTADHGHQPIRWIGSKLFTINDLLKNPKARPIRIQKNAMGDNTPSRDLMVSRQHRILCRSKIAERMFDHDEVLIAAAQLTQVPGIDSADGKSVATGVKYFHILFDNHEIIEADGAPIESLLIAAQSASLLDGPSFELPDDALFPSDLKSLSRIPARPIINGKFGRKLATRLLKNKKPVLDDHESLRVLKRSGKFGQRAKMYPTRMNGYENDEATELFRQV